MPGPDLSKRIVYRVDGMSDARVRREIVYKRDADTELKMNIYAPAHSSATARAPAVFFVHGGPIASDFMPPTPMINETIDQFVQEALAGNATLDVMNHAAGRHGFDILDDNDRSREIIARAVAFARAHVHRSDR